MHNTQSQTQPWYVISEPVRPHGLAKVSLATSTTTSKQDVERSHTRLGVNWANQEQATATDNCSVSAPMQLGSGRS